MQELRNGIRNGIRNEGFFCCQNFKSLWVCEAHLKVHEKLEVWKKYA